MKTLLEWLEENRSKLTDGVYEYCDGGVASNGISSSWFNAISFTTDKYEVKNGNITLVTPITLAGQWEQWNKYNRQCKGVTIDVYDVLKAFEVTDPALQHLVKKALCAGLRGYKTMKRDLEEVLESAKRAVELNK